MNLYNFTTKYVELLNGPLAGLNLTRILGRDDIYHKQVLDSVIPFRNCDSLKSVMADKKFIIDVGFGGGFPLFPLAIEFPNLQIVGVESIGKKVRACKLISDSIGLLNLRLINDRIEKMSIDVDALVTFKAVGKVEDMLKFVNVAPGNKVAVLFYKGPAFNEELDFNNPSWVLVDIYKYRLHNDSERSTLLYENVPRGTIKNKSLVKLSELILE